MNNLLKVYDIKVFTLSDTLENIIKKEKYRKSRTPLNERVKDCYSIMESNLNEMNSIIIDNSKDIENCIKQIEKLLL